MEGADGGNRSPLLLDPDCFKEQRLLRYCFWDSVIAYSVYSVLCAVEEVELHLRARGNAVSVRRIDVTTFADESESECCDYEVHIVQLSGGLQCLT